MNLQQDQRDKRAQTSVQATQTVSVACGTTEQPWIASLAPTSGQAFVNGDALAAVQVVNVPNGVTPAAEFERAVGLLGQEVEKAIWPLSFRPKERAPHVTVAHRLDVRITVIGGAERPPSPNACSINCAALRSGICSPSAQVAWADNTGEPGRRASGVCGIDKSCSLVEVKCG